MSMTTDQKVWLRCMEALMTIESLTTKDAARFADEGLVEFRKRWPRGRWPAYVEPDPLKPGTFRKMVANAYNGPIVWETWTPPDEARARAALEQEEERLRDG